VRCESYPSGLCIPHEQAREQAAKPVDIGKGEHNEAMTMASAGPLAGARPGGRARANRATARGPKTQGPGPKDQGSRAKRAQGPEPRARARARARTRATARAIARARARARVRARQKG
jgi:hypothetical protein